MLFVMPRGRLPPSIRDLLVPPKQSPQHAGAGVQADSNSVLGCMGSIGDFCTKRVQNLDQRGS